MQSAIPLACFLSIIRPPGVQFENSLLQIAPVDKAKCPFIRNNNDVGFQLYTRHNPTVYQELLVNDDEKLFASNLDLHATTVIYFHAFMEAPGDGSGVMVREAYMLRGDTNVIMVDAQRLEAGPWYFTAAENTWYIGRFAAQFIDYLVSRGLDLSRTHLVGHSLGAQAAGVAGAALKSGRVARITGLDPALPLFSKVPLEQKLDASDAEFVDVIHTDAGIFGVYEPIGHADFYPNGGISPQPGCELEVVLPQHMLLNKCDIDTKPMEFYTFYLAANKPKPSRHESKRKYNELFSYLQAAKPLISKYATKTGITSQKYEYLKSYIDLQSTRYQEYRTDIPFHITKRTEKNNNQELLKQEDTLRNIGKVVPLHYQHHSQRNITENSKKVTRQDILELVNMQTLHPIPKQTDFKGALKNEKQQKSLNNQDKLTLETLENPEKQSQPETSKQIKSHVVKRQKRFIPFFKQSESTENDNFLFRMLEFLLKNRKSIIPVFSVMREINTLVKSGNGELNHFIKERNNYIGAPPPLIPVTYSLELGNGNRATAFVKRLFGLGPNGDRLTINGSK